MYMLCKVLFQQCPICFTPDNIPSIELTYPVGPIKTKCKSHYSYSISLMVSTSKVCFTKQAFIVKTLTHLSDTKTWSSADGDRVTYRWTRA